MYRHWREVHKLAGATTGLHGAVQRLMVNEKTYQNLAVNVTQHNTKIYDGLPCPSNSNPCRNGGVCFPLLNSFFCKCRDGYDGINCEFCKSSEFRIRVFERCYLYNTALFYTYSFQLCLTGSIECK